MIAFGAVAGAKFESGRTRRDAREHHAGSAVRAMKFLNGEQRDRSEIIGHGFPPWIRRGVRRLPITGRHRTGTAIESTLRFSGSESLVKIGQFSEIVRRR